MTQEVLEKEVDLSSLFISANRHKKDLAKKIAKELSEAKETKSLNTLALMYLNFRLEKENEKVFSTRICTNFYEKRDSRIHYSKKNKKKVFNYKVKKLKSGKFSLNRKDDTFFISNTAYSNLLKKYNNILFAPISETYEIHRRSKSYAVNSTLLKEIMRKTGIHACILRQKKADKKARKRTASKEKLYDSKESEALYKKIQKSCNAYNALIKQRINPEQYEEAKMAIERDDGSLRKRVYGNICSSSKDRRKELFKGFNNYDAKASVHTLSQMVYQQEIKDIYEEIIPDPTIDRDLKKNIVNRIAYCDTPSKLLYKFYKGIGDDEDIAAYKFFFSKAKTTDPKAIENVIKDLQAEYKRRCGALQHEQPFFLLESLVGVQVCNTIMMKHPQGVAFPVYDCVYANIGKEEIEKTYQEVREFLTEELRPVFARESEEEKREKKEKRAFFKKLNYEKKKKKEEEERNAQTTATKELGTRTLDGSPDNALTKDSYMYEPYGEPEPYDPYNDSQTVDDWLSYYA